MELPKFEFIPEKRKYMFWIARIFGKKLAHNMYHWRGKLWITGEVKDPFED